MQSPKVSCFWSLRRKWGQRRKGRARGIASKCSGGIGHAVSPDVHHHLVWLKFRTMVTRCGPSNSDRVASLKVFLSNNTLALASAPPADLLGFTFGVCKVSALQMRPKPCLKSSPCYAQHGLSTKD
eukprot:1838668-Amphidinium_carterae.1